MRSRSDKNEGLARVGATWPRKAIAWVVGVALVGGCVWLAYSTLMPQRSEVVAIPFDQPAAPVAQVPTQAPPELVDLTGLVKPIPPAPVAAGPPLFVDETATSGVSQRYDGPDSYQVGGGIAVFDCDGDRMPDL